MSRRKKCKPRMIPQQDKRICGCICFCQLIVVFSCVSLIYLTVVIYIPSYRAFHSDFEERPVMCQTINTSMLNNCSWASCGEWCLTKTSGFCPQIHATTRQNGTIIQLENCFNFSTAYCPPVNTNKLIKYNCNNGTSCSSLKGLFNCSLGHCLNMSQLYDCQYKADGFTVDNDKDNVKLNGFFDCKGEKCTKIKKHFTCDRICTDRISTLKKNIFLLSDNSVFSVYCENAYAITEANGNEEGFQIKPTQFWSKSDPILMISCINIHFNQKGSYINASDCINGSLYDTKNISTPSMTFKQFWNLTNHPKRLVDPKNRFVPIQSILTIYNHSRLYINLDGCVNTLKGECVEFLRTHGPDGKNQTAQSRYPCYYKKNDSFMVISRFNLKKTWNDLIISISIPSILFIVSFITLCIIMQSVRVGDDAKMRCKYCLTENNSDLTEMITTMTPKNDKYNNSNNSPTNSSIN